LSKVIILKQLKLKNFKGIKEFALNTGGYDINVYGNNGTGKTTLFDGFLWLLFGKDSADLSKFDVQPLDSQNNVIHMLDTEVEGALSIDNKNMTFKKVLKEKWVKKRGEVNAELKGTETSYYIDEVPMKEGEYKQQVSNITGGEDIFKLITNPMYFSTVLKWQDRRKIVTQITGDISDEQVINYKDELKPLAKLLHDTDIEKLKISISAKLKKLKKDKEDIPARVDELNMSIKDIDFDALDTQKRSIMFGMNNIDDQLADSSKVDEAALQGKKKLYELQSKLLVLKQSIDSEAIKPLEEYKKQIATEEKNFYTVQSAMDKINYEIQSKEVEVSRIQKLNDDLRDKWKVENSKTFEMPEDSLVCPTCKRPFDEDDIDAKRQEMEGNFNLRKADILKGINADGKANKEKIDKLNAEVAELQKRYKEIDKELNNIADKKIALQDGIDNFKVDIDYSSNSEYAAIQDGIKAIEAKSDKKDDNELLQVQQLKSKKAELEKELETINNQLAYKETNESAKKRIKELQEQEKNLAQQIADIEKTEYLTEQFTKAKVELLESSINSKFKYVRFRMFKNQVNGGIEEDCEPLIKGVPFNTNLNSGAKTNAGIDIINTLCNYYQINAPVFLDNCESVTEIIPTQGQIIRLIVPTPYERLDSTTKQAWIDKYKDGAEAAYYKSINTLRIERVDE